MGRTWSKRFSAASDESDVSRSSRSVQPGLHVPWRVGYHTSHRTACGATAPLRVRAAEAPGRTYRHKRAADAAVGELDHLLLLLQHAAASHQLRVDVHRSHVVHYHRDTVASAVVQHVIEKRRLASTKEAGEHCHRKRAGAAGRTHDLRGLANHRIRVRGLPRSTCHSCRIPLAPPLLDCCGLSLGCHHSFDSSPRFSSRSLSMRRDPSGLRFSLDGGENHACTASVLLFAPPRARRMHRGRHPAEIAGSHAVMMMMMMHHHAVTPRPPHDKARARDRRPQGQLTRSVTRAEGGPRRPRGAADAGRCAAANKSADEAQTALSQQDPDYGVVEPGLRRRLRHSYSSVPALESVARARALCAVGCGGVGSRPSRAREMFELPARRSSADI